MRINPTPAAQRAHCRACSPSVGDSVDSLERISLAGSAHSFRLSASSFAVAVV